jgi:hypothetical protein
MPWQFSAELLAPGADPAYAEAGAERSAIHLIPHPMPQKIVHHLALSIPVFFLKEKRAYIAYTPALDLSASGSSIPRARKNFDVVLRLFMEELLKHGTFGRVLEEMGWSKEEGAWQPPIEIEKTVKVPFRLPVAA